MSGPSGHGTVGPKPNGWMAQFLRKEAEQQAALLEGLRTRLIAQLERQGKLDAAALPDKDWCRVARLYQEGYRALASLELETAKVQLLAERAARDRPPMTDEEYAQEMADLGRDAVKALPDDELRAELARRGLALPAGR